MTEFKAGDTVRVTRRPTATWAPEMYVGRVFTVRRVGLPGAPDALCDNDTFYIAADCVEAVTQPVATERTGPYGGNDPSHEQVIAELTAKLPANEAARARNVAALKLELDRKSPPRHPPESRSDRVYGGRRWGER